ncbi:hypothetical protein BDV27DRAFT_126886 [Aspergillus caelatus]|uniref:Uncharacterized protein n=1 Tax=Aspergillus caelatus TaxID=61420 RepID=A0A5N7A8G7_9EURO|nr:uncharacterized protein BDV27DRAFT_126886 [Aspergillus caelatus]KAE8365419.1 hypothetical protein BDV27DRAFT_126886 [Aspergillus caelatus]
MDKKLHSRITWFLLATGYWLPAGKAEIGDLFSGALLRDGDWGCRYSGGGCFYCTPSVYMYVLCTLLLLCSI